jgi:hypothetical protein
MHFAQAQLVELGELHALGHALGLVRAQHRRLAQLAQVPGDVVVLRRQAAARVYHEDDDVGFRNGLPRLLGHLHVDAALGRRLEAAGVDHDEFVLAVLRVAVVAVAREAGEIGDDGVARLGQPVEQRRLADVGAAHQGHYGFHVKPVPPSQNLSADGPPLGARAPSGGSAAGLPANVGATSA